MKRIILLFSGVIASLIISAQNSDYFNYQAIIRDANGNPKSNTNVSIVIEIIQGSTTGTVVFSETHAKTTNGLGLITLSIGSVNPSSFASINWANAPFFIRLSVDGVDMGTSQLLSVPFALRAKKVESYSETDPIFLAHPANGISASSISNWNTAYGWGNHASAGYLTGFTETDPVFLAHPTNGITASSISNWNTAYGWGNHASAGYLTSFTEADPIFLAHPANGISASSISNWNTAYGWGNHTGLYKTITYLPDWSEITNNPFNFSSPSDNQLLKYNSTSSKWENWTSNFLSLEVDGSVTNEIQTLNLNSNQLSISGTGGNTITFTNWDTDKTDDVALTSPTTGDMLYFNGTSWTSIPKGTTNQVLTMNISGIPEWQNPAQIHPAITQAATYNLPNVTINGTVNPNNLPTTVKFEYGTSTSYGNTVTATQSPVSGYSNINVSYTITSGLIAGTTYHFRVKTENALGIAYGADMAFDYLAIGLSWKGGLIFYIDGTGQHGLVAAETDQSTSASWGCKGTQITSAEGTAIGTGNSNTTAIVANCSTIGIAAEICFNLSLNTYDDWFLPSKDELQLMYNNLKVAGLGGFSAVNYWSSSEYSLNAANNAWKLNFGTNSMGTNGKDISYYIRAVRAF